MAYDEHTVQRENIPAYAIGALDAEEVAALETHLETCVSCRTELAGFRLAGESLLTAVPPKQPPAVVRKRLQDRLPGAQRSTHLQSTFSFSRLAWGFALVALLILNLFSFLQLRQIQSQQAALLNQVENARVALAILSSPNLQTFPIDDGNVTGTVILSNEQNQAVLIVRNLPLPEENQIYQIWLIKPDGGRVSAGLFRPASGESYITQTISSSGSFSDYLGIGITVEPAGGSDAPTGERVFKVDF